MYQFYYSKEQKELEYGFCKDYISNHFRVDKIRPMMWEEHCLECSAPLCYKNCLHYEVRTDGRCKRFDNGMLVLKDERGCCGQKVHIKFRKWANMMTIIFPSMLSRDEYANLTIKNHRLGLKLKKIADSGIPVKIKWQIIRTIEYIRRRKLRKMSVGEKPDAFVFHGYSYEKEVYNLIFEVYEGHNPSFKMALRIKPGENLYVINYANLSEECWKPDNIIKIYPENNIEAEIDLLWCDFVKGAEIDAEKPASKVKCVVWDLDNTLWDGVLIETENSNELKLREGVLEVIQELDRRGIVQSIASKNDFDNAWPVIKSLGLDEYFLYPQIHWNAKSASMKVIAHQLNIGIDTLALIDDSEFERHQVLSKCPQVRVYDENIIANLLHLPEFDVLITEESKLRREMYRAEERRNILKNENNDDTVEFLKKCHLKLILFKPKTSEEIARCYELLVRTNQLNMSGRKYTWDEFLEVLNRTDCHNYAFSSRDDFGNYGIVGFGQYKIDVHKLIFTEFAMSCRVAGKFVESALFSALLSMNKCDQGIFSIYKTKKNILLRRTLEEIGFDVIDENNGQVHYSYKKILKNSNLINVIQREE